MKMKPLTLLVALMLVIPSVVFAYVEPEKGSMDNPFYSSKTEEGTTEFTGLNEDVTANITVSVVGELKVGPTYEKISELTMEEVRGPLYFCYKVLIKANDLKGGKTISITAEDFKVYDWQRIEVPILTQFEEVELLNGTGAYMYIGVRTFNRSFPMFIVFNNELWFDLLSAPMLDG